MDNQIPRVSWNNISFNETWEIENKDEIIKKYKDSVKKIILDGYDFLSTFEINK